jgi:F5/8 type C domain
MKSEYQMKRAASLLIAMTLGLSACNDPTSNEPVSGSMISGSTASGSTVSGNTRLTGQAVCAPTNLALGRAGKSSADESPNTPPQAAFDGNQVTHWSSPFSDPQWVQVDLGSAQPICQVVLQWEGTAAYGKAFEAPGLLFTAPPLEWAGRRPLRPPAPPPGDMYGCTARYAAPATGIRCKSFRCTAVAQW